MSDGKKEVPNPLENKGEEQAAIKPAKGVHRTPDYVAVERDRKFVLNDGVTVREDF